MKEFCLIPIKFSLWKLFLKMGICNYSLWHFRIGCPVGSRRPTSNWRNFITVGKDNLKHWGSTTSYLVNEKNYIFSMSISWDTFAISKDVMLFLYSFPHHMAVSVWVLLEILTNISVIHLVPLSLLTWKANSGPGAGRSLAWSVDFIRQSVGLPCSAEMLSVSGATHLKRKPSSLLWCLKACIIFHPFFSKQQKITLSPGHHSLP